MRLKKQPIKKFLNATVLKQLDSTVFTILNVEVYQDNKQNKEKINVYLSQKDTTYIWTPSKTVINWLIDTYGEETNNWYGKQITLTLIKVNVKGEIKDSIIPEQMLQQQEAKTKRK